MPWPERTVASPFHGTKSRNIMTSEFSGFPAGTLKFLRDLEKNNNREWFQQNRQRYEEFFLQPSLAFIAAMHKPLAKTAPLLQAIPKGVGGSLMRIYRDTRFSKAKEPYKTNIGIHFRHQLGCDVHAPGCYVHVARDECFFGAGIWMPDSEPLRLIRTKIHEAPNAWKKAVGNKRFASQFKLHEERLKSMPRGFAKDSPMSDAIRLTSFIGVCQIDKKILEGPELVKFVDQAVRDAKPLMSFLCEALNIPY